MFRSTYPQGRLLRTLQVIRRVFPVVVANEPVTEYRLRTRVFVDFWSFQSSMRREESWFNIAYEPGLGPVLAPVRQRALSTPGDRVEYQGMNMGGTYLPHIYPTDVLWNTAASVPPASGLLKSLANADAQASNVLVVTLRYNFAHNATLICAALRKRVLMRASLLI